MPHLSRKHCRQAYHFTNPNSKTKGVSTLIQKYAGFEVTHNRLTQRGDLSSLRDNRKASLSHLEMSAHITFCQHVVGDLKGLSSGCLILGRDFNVQLNPFQDTSNGKSSINFRILKKTQNPSDLINSGCVARH